MLFDLIKKNDIKSVSVDEVDNLLGEISLIDIREPFEYKATSIRGSKNIPMSNLLGNPEKFLLKDKEYYIICQSGGRSSRACSKLNSLGFNVINVKGGIGSYSGKNRK